MTRCPQRSGPRAGVRAIVLGASLAALSGHGLARAQDAPPAPTPVPSADEPPPSEVTAAQGAAPWDDRAALARWFDETCAVVEDVLGEKFQRRPTLRVVTRRELELVLREDVKEAGGAPEIVAAGMESARYLSGARAVRYDRRAHAVCLAPGNRHRGGIDSESSAFGPLPDRLALVAVLSSGWVAERHPWARVVPSPADYEASMAHRAVLAGHAAWVVERAAPRWGLDGAWARYVEGVRTLPTVHASFDPLDAGSAFVRDVDAREGDPGIRRVLRAPPRRLRDLEAPFDGARELGRTPPYFDLWSVADALLAPFPRLMRGRTRPRVTAPYDGALRGPRRDDLPIDAVRQGSGDGVDGHLELTILRFRSPAAADRFAAAAAVTSSNEGLLEEPSHDFMAVETVEDGAGLDRRSRGITIQREWVFAEQPVEIGRGVIVVVGTLVGRIDWRGSSGSGPDVDGLSAALESRVRALARGEPIVPMTAFPRVSGAAPPGSAGPRAAERVRAIVLVRRADGTPVVGARVELGTDTPRSAEWTSRWSAVSDGEGRAVVRVPSGAFPLRVEVEPPPDVEDCASAEATMSLPGTQPLVVTLPRGWVANGRLSLDGEAARQPAVIALLPDGRRVEEPLDYDGSFHLRHLPVGPVVLRALWNPSLDGPRFSERHVVSPGSPAVILVPATNPRPAAPEFVVRGPGGAPVVDVRSVPRRTPSENVSLSMEAARRGTAWSHFDLGDLEGRVLVLRASLADGRRLAPREVQVAGGTKEPLVVELAEAVSTLGRVLDATGRGVAGARVEGGVLDAPWAATEAVTDGSGAFRLEGLAAGPCWLAVVATPTTHVPADAVRAVAGATDVVLRVENTIDVVLEVLDPAGSPVVGADVTFTIGRRAGDRSAQRTELRATSDTSGRVTWAGVRADARGRLEVRPPTSRALAAIVRRSTSLTVSESIRLPEAYTVSGRVERNGAPVVDADVRLSTRAPTAPETWLDVLVKPGPDGRFVVPHVPVGPAVLRLEDPGRWGTEPTLSHDPVAVASPQHPDVVLRASNFTNVSFLVDGAAGRPLHLCAVRSRWDRAAVTADEHGRFEWIEAADVPHELWIPPTPEDPRVAYLPDYVPGPTPPTLTLTAPGIARFRRPAFEGGQVDGATVEDAWVVGPLGMAFAARLVADGRFEVDGLPPGTFPAVARVRTGKGWVRCTGPVTVGAPEVELPRP